MPVRLACAGDRAVAGADRDVADALGRGVDFDHRGLVAAGIFAGSVSADHVARVDDFAVNFFKVEDTHTTRVDEGELVDVDERVDGEGADGAARVDKRERTVLGGDNRVGVHLLDDAGRCFG